jgi:60 kDa SS-A/Ro ribonucleoprotein
MKFNFKLFNKNKVTNYEGAEAYTLSPQLELYTAVASGLLSDNNYEKGEKRLERLAELVQKNDTAFVAKMAVYAREKMYLRSVPVVLAVELAKKQSANGVVSKTVSRIVQRADEITEVLAYYQFANGRAGTKKLNKLSKQIQKGLGEAFNKFDEYQFAKYNSNAEVKLKDALFLVHPKAKTEAQQALFNKIAKDELATPYTWETELSALGQVKFYGDGEKARAFKNKWEELVMSGKLGYMALLRNLRNILEAGVSSEALSTVCNMLANPKAVEKAKQLPFRYLAAYRELAGVPNGNTGKVLSALEKAAELSAANVAGFNRNTRVLIATDFSGSMQTAVSKQSKMQLYEVGAMLSMVLASKCSNVITGMFGETWKVINVPKTNILSNAAGFAKRIGEVGHSTNGYLVLRYLIDRNVVVDKVVVFTDCQLWDSNAGNMYSMAALWKQYKKIAPEAKIYLFDLAGYGNTPLNVMEKDVYLIAGWSEKIFDVLEAIENGSNAVKEVMKIDI